VRVPVDEAGETDASVPDRARTGRLQIRLPQVRGSRRSAAAHPLEADAMKWVDDLKASAAAFRDWGRVLTIIGCVMAGALVVIAAELFVICLKI
jgi:hypothetical protein